MLKIKTLRYVIVLTTGAVITTDPVTGDRVQITWIQVRSVPNSDIKTEKQDGGDVACFLRNDLSGYSLRAILL